MLTANIVNANVKPGDLNWSFTSAWRAPGTFAAFGSRLAGEVAVAIPCSSRGIKMTQWL